jgi:EAL domain-containing protein (putative c-di-GMP-specific phosphodiesterase class I)
MLKELRNLMQMLDDLDDEAPAAVPLESPVAVELPQSLEPIAPAPGIVPPATFIFDSDAGHAEALSSMLRASGTDAQIFGETSSFVRGLLTRTPAMVFIDVADQGDGAIDALFAMGERGFRGGVQLMGAEVSPVVELVQRIGERHALQMLPTVKKPLETSTVLQVLSTQNLKLIPTASATLGEAMAEGLVEFWYQPKIDLIKRQIAGVETFARVRHPELGTLPPGIFMRGATEADLVRLTQKALTAALRAAADFAEVGVNLRVAVNVPVRALFELPIARMVREIGPKTPRWPGLLLDVTVSQLAVDFARIEALGAELAACNTRLAVDDFGRGSLSIAALKQLPVAELKLDRAFVNGCADDPSRAKVCASVIELAHHLGCIAVAVGIERVADMKALTAMGCDVGQGFLFGQPMPENDLVGLLLKRVHKQPVATPAAEPTPPPPPATAPTPAAAKASAPAKASVPAKPARPAIAAKPRPLKRAVW